MLLTLAASGVSVYAFLFPFRLPLFSAFLVPSPVLLSVGFLHPVPLLLAVLAVVGWWRASRLWFAPHAVVFALLIVPMLAFILFGIALLDSQLFQAGNQGDPAVVAATLGWALLWIAAGWVNYRTAGGRIGSHVPSQ